MFDSHAHYYDAKFLQTENGVDCLLESLFQNGITHIINVSTCYDTAVSAIEQARKYPNLYCAVGLYPEDAEIGDVDVLLSRIESLVCDETKRKTDKIVAIGEIGLDYHNEIYDKEKQKYAMERQFQMAEKYRLPVIIHDRLAHGDCFDMVLKYPNVSGVFHSFSGSPEFARDLTRRGWYLSFSGPVTYKNATNLQEAVRVTPSDKILVETDAPYLPPVPFRGQLNDSLKMKYTLQKIAELKEISFEKAEEITTNNAKDLLRIS